MAAVRKPRNRSGVIESDPEDDLKPEPASVKQEISSGLVDMDTDISQLEAPTFTTLADRGPSQAMINLQWHHTANLIGKKVVNPPVHVCEKCRRPILIYGRMIPCKHVFCLQGRHLDICYLNL